MKKTHWGLHIATLIGLAILIALGTWQVKRLAWKEGLIAEIDTRMKSAPVPLASIEERFKTEGDVDYFPISLTGAIQNENEQYFLSTHDGQSGWNVYAAQASDGHNFDDDMERCLELLNQDLLPQCQYFAYIEVAPEDGMPSMQSVAWGGYQEVAEANAHFAMKRVTNAGEIYPVFRELFAAQPAKEGRR